MSPQCFRNKRKKKKDSFAAREIFKQYGSKEWNEGHFKKKVGEFFTWVNLRSYMKDEQ
ncbi:hypothetical protein SDJN02_12317 [Cucurbita argyrosperma subsp. argyrosperma]|nr:hypothetical protein SDJN02_12317 [Cucurbita argyrosperma subsp. argyrosperma]